MQKKNDNWWSFPVLKKIWLDPTQVPKKYLCSKSTSSEMINSELVFFTTKTVFEKTYPKDIFSIFEVIVVKISNSCNS